MPAFPRGLVVSCQGPDDTPLDSPHIMVAMAWAAEAGGAVAVRAEGEPDLRAIRREIRIPVIGLIKRRLPSSDVYITPTIDDALLVAACGADIIAVDATGRARPDGTRAQEFIERVKAATGLPVMADISTAVEADVACAAGADYVSTTLSGYTAYATLTHRPDIRLVSVLQARLSVPLLAEGRYATQDDVLAAMRAGAYGVVVGTAITNPLEITRRFVAAAQAGLGR